MDNPTPHAPPLPTKALPLLELRAKCRVLKIAYRLARLPTAGRRSPWMTPPSPCAHAPRMVRRDARMVRRDRAWCVAHRTGVRLLLSERESPRLASTRIDSPHVTGEIRLSEVAVEAMAELIGCDWNSSANSLGISTCELRRCSRELRRCSRMLGNSSGELRRCSWMLRRCSWMLNDWELVTL